MRRLALILSCSLCSLLVACTTEPEDEGDAGTETGEPANAATLVVETDPEAVCGEFGGAVELVTRRVDCWDPQLPCTLAQDPPWVMGTSADCSMLTGGVVRFEVEVQQNGRWESRLQAGGQLACFGQAGEARTNVSRDDVTSGAELLLAPAPAGECGEP